ncbi:hypothetical protein MtrunA17_Chr5g0406581 [Medicago truncatula]|uniref:Uncharacterized protein n=1 Tax=Medicago truncatula TaxID=3880 RepID=A0A396HUP0_MEDTR|nr:hypothetical protein MtrunA17_Chr5g0406581 [Medicago truncatula]
MYYGGRSSNTMVKLKHKKLEAFYNRKLPEEDANCIASTSNLEKNPSGDQTVQPDEQPCKIQRVIVENFDVNCLERDPGKCLQIWEYPVNQRDVAEKYPLNG